ncbi:MAG: FliM/FliN family flagellar motor C-terminal domain-containing protein [Francisellaceae bacterium]
MRYKLLSDSQFSALKTQLIDKLTEWSQTWLGQMQIEITKQKASLVSIDAFLNGNEKKVLYRDDKIVFLMAHISKTEDSWQNLNHSLIDRLKEHIDQALLSALICDHETFITYEASTKKTLPAGDVLIVKLESKRQTIQLIISSALYLKWLPKTSLDDKDRLICDRKMAILPQEIELKLSIPEFSLNAEELLSLSIGNVIVGEHKLNQPLIISYGDNAIARGYLVKQEQKKAIVLHE